VRSNNKGNWRIFDRTVKRCLQGKYLPLLPITGSGFNRFILSSNDPENCALISWRGLLLEVARLEKIAAPLWKTRAIAPAIMWDEMVVSLALATHRKSHHAELLLRKRVASVLNDESVKFDQSNRDVWHQFLRNSHVSPITGTLNFDARWMVGKAFSRPAAASWSATERDNISRIVSDIESRNHVFHIHGTTVSGRRGGSASCSIVLGAHQYAHLVHNAKRGFEHFKSWERRISQRRGDMPLTGPEFTRVISAWRENLQDIRTDNNSVVENATSKLNWVYAMCLQPVIFLGCGLSQTEWDIWWVLTQRRRNIARIKDAPPVFVLRWQCEPMSAEQKQFWLRPPLGIRVLWCKTWAEGWLRVMNTTG
jgi:hypothetical protein